MLTYRIRPLLPRQVYFSRIARSAGLAAGILLGSLVLGAVGYHLTEGLPWLDAFLNASMILTGMGPVDSLHTVAGKVFATCYALFSGVVFLTAVAVLGSPILHRFLHRFHMDFYEEPASKD